MIDKKLFGKVLIRMDEKTDDHSYRNEPIQLFYADKKTTIQASMESPYYSNSDFYDTHDFAPLEDVIEAATPVFERIKLTVVPDHKMFIGDRSYLYNGESEYKFDKDLIDILYKLPNNTYAIRIYNEASQDYSTLGKTAHLIDCSFIDTPHKQRTFVEKIDPVPKESVYNDLIRYLFGYQNSHEKILNFIKANKPITWSKGEAIAFKLAKNKAVGFYKNQLKLESSQNIKSEEKDHTK